MPTGFRQDNREEQMDRLKRFRGSFYRNGAVEKRSRLTRLAQSREIEMSWNALRSDLGRKKQTYEVSHIRYGGI